MKYLIVFSFFVINLFSNERVTAVHKTIHSSDFLLCSFKEENLSEKGYKYPFLSFSEVSNRELSKFSLDVYKILFNLGWSGFFIPSIEKASDSLPSIKPTRIFHIESINIHKIQALKTVLKHIKSICNAKVSLNLSGDIINHKNRFIILNFLKEHVDIFFCDSRAVRQLTGLSSKLSCQYFSGVFNLESIIFERKGCWTSDKQHCLFHPFSQQAVIDSSLSLFICGFLHGVLKDQPLVKCLDIGTNFVEKSQSDY